VTLQVVKLTLGGHQPVRVGKTTHHVPRGSRVAHVSGDGGALAYVYDGVTVHCLVEAGEIEMSERMQAHIRTKVFDVE
jgi:hypothetical protein